MENNNAKLVVYFTQNQLHVCCIHPWDVVGHWLGMSLGTQKNFAFLAGDKIGRINQLLKKYL